MVARNLQKVSLIKTIQITIQSFNSYVIIAFSNFDFIANCVCIQQNIWRLRSNIVCKKINQFMLPIK